MSTAPAHSLPALIEQLLRATRAREVQRVATALRHMISGLDATASVALHDWSEALIAERQMQLAQYDQLAANLARLQSAERLQRALYTIAEQAGSERSLPEVMHTMHDIVRTLMYAENCYFVLHDTRADTVRFAYYADVADPDPPHPEHHYPLEEMRYSPTWHLIRGGQALRGPLDEIARQVQGPLRAAGPMCVDWLGVPMRRGDEVIGAIAVQSYRDDARYSAEDQALLSYVAQHIQSALERREAHVDLEKRVHERTEALREANRVLQQQVLERQRGERLQASLFRIAELAGTSDSLESFYAAVHRVIGGLLYARNFYIALLSEDGRELQFPYSVDERDAVRRPRRIGRGLTEYVITRGAALLANESDMQALREAGEVVQSGSDSVCWLGVPLVLGERTVGALVVQSYMPEHRYTTRDQDLLTFVSYHIANALDRRRSADTLKAAYADLERRVAERTRALALANRDLREQVAERERAERRLKFETLHDSLTGLPNRNLLVQRIEHALERHKLDTQRRFAVLFLDLDRFKVINDSVGHLVGDDLLFQAGSRIRGSLKSQDVVARLGGDEFAVLIENVHDIDEVTRVADRIIASMQAPFQLGQKEMFTSVSIGIAMAEPHYVRPEELLRDADSAMYRAKAEGRQRWAVFDDLLRREAVLLLDLEVDLRRALARGEFVPYYQPITRLADGATVGYEALVRWLHPQRGVLEPGQFLAVAEDNGSSEAMDWMVFERVAAEARQLLGDSGFVSINLSARHFRSSGLTARLLALLGRHEIAPERLRIEVTERVLLDNPEEFKRTLADLREQGIAVSLDDFGTGYSSLSYLHQYPLQALKIDRSFVIALDDGETGNGYAVIRTIQALASTLGMSVIAEGIEDAAQNDLLLKLGCPYGQGYLYGRPQPLASWIGTPPANVVWMKPAR
ncbi:EAL domain-containing protein [Metallibacterium sp.]|uniref:bifunctional diguanylate cyclase/phosphodiesterase n=1 Tax=Metallibacterium sp. TaxID=2940281 RepID=UPI0026231238|nr:EAL domain-containing protein [Metallibacterium sp.]